MLLAQGPQHFGGALWHSFDHARGYHPDMFYGGLMTSARIPKTSYWMMKAELAKPGPKIPNVDLGPFVHVAHDLTPFSPKESSKARGTKSESISSPATLSITVWMVRRRRRSR